MAQTDMLLTLPLSARRDVSLRGDRMLRATALALSLAGLLLSACAAPQPGRSAASGAPAETDSPPDEASLRARAEKLWTAKTKQDWASVFDVTDPTVRRDAKVDEYVRWAEANEPFKVHEFTIHRVAAEGEMGWVELSEKTSLRRYPAIPPTERRRWEKWRVVDGRWYPVPPREIDLYPRPPVERDLAAEKSLRERFARTVELRQKRDFAALYEMAAPIDREKVSLEQFAEIEEKYEYKEADVQWVEAADGSGRVGVIYGVKLVDPNLTKLAANYVWRTEPWVLVDGQWYYRLTSAPHPVASGEPSGPKPAE